jgi:twitching motility protein PilU
VLTFYSEAHYNQVLIDLSLNLRACISQRLVPRFDSEGRVLVQEILYQSSFASKLIEKGNITALKDLMAKSNEVGMQTFDQHLFQLYRSGVISLDSTIAFADSADDMRLMIKLNRSIDVDADRVDTDAAEITINMD